MQMIRADGKSAYLDGPLDLRNKPSFAVRGIHLNGWPLNYPYAFRSWKEADWKKFIDIAWAQRINLFYLWPFMEILPVPLSVEDEAYLQEVRRVVDYAKNERGMEVWIMQSANRIGTSDCGTPDPRVPSLLGQRLPEGHEPGGSAAVRARAEVVRSVLQERQQCGCLLLYRFGPGRMAAEPGERPVKDFQRSPEVAGPIQRRRITNQAGGLDARWMGPP